MKSKKAFLSLVAMVLVLVMFSGCTPKASTTPEGTGDVQPTASTPPAQTTPEASGEKVELEFFSQKPEAVPVMEEIIQLFMNENPGVTITQTSTQDARTVLQTRISTNDIPDILNTFPAEEMYKIMFEEDMILELTGQEFLNNVNENTLAMSAYNGKNYALPMTLSSYGIYYRTDIFEQNNLSKPTTWDELMDVCEKLSAASITPFVFANKDLGNIGQRFERLVGVINNDINSEFQQIAKGELAVTDSPSLKAFADMLVAITSYGPADSLGVDTDSSFADYLNGKTAMMVSGTWGLGTMKAGNPEVAENTELIPFPNPTGEKTNVPINIDTSFSISSTCEHPDVALKFLEFMARPEIAQIYADKEGTPNMIKGVNYNVPQHKYITTFMDSGDMFLTAVNFWPAGLREDLRNPAQILIMDGDKDAFIQACGPIIDQYYNK